MKFSILNENKTLYIIPCGFILLDVLMRFFGAEATRLSGTLLILSVFCRVSVQSYPHEDIPRQKRASHKSHIHKENRN